jgi:hypothetical protein
MTKEQMWKDACNQAYSITKSYRDQAPQGYDCYNVVGTATALIASAVIAVVGASISAYGMYQQGQSQKAVADYNE